MNGKNILLFIPRLVYVFLTLYQYEKEYVADIQEIGGITGHKRKRDRLYNQQPWEIREKIFHKGLMCRSLEP